MAARAMISVQEYLDDPRYELAEYLDGVIVEKYPLIGGVPLVTNAHSFLVGLILGWFHQHIDAWQVWAGTEAHTRIHDTRYRLPDISVLRLGRLEQIQVSAPLVVIEVLSPSNTMSDMLKKLKDYEYLSVPNIWIIDPETRVGLVCRGAQMISTSRLTVEGTQIYLDVSELFDAFDKNQGL